MKSCFPYAEQKGHEEELGLFQRALTETLERHWQEELATSEPTPKEPSRCHQENMNCIFREQVGGSFQPYPEEK